MSYWRPSLSEFTVPFKHPKPWGVSLERYGKGIDNAHVDVFLSPRLRERLRDTARKLILEDVRTAGRRAPEQLVGTSELESFRESYLAMFEATLERCQADASADHLLLFQFALLKCLLQDVAGENLLLQEELKSATHSSEMRESGQILDLHESLVVLTMGEHTINRKVLHILFRELRKLESSCRRKLRAAMGGDVWSLSADVFFNPVLMVPDLNEVQELAQDYPITMLAQTGDMDWLFQTNQCISKVFQHYLPGWTQLPSSSASAAGARGHEPRERLDQGQLKGFVETEILLSRFVPKEEYRQGQVSWLDEPENLRLFLSSGEVRPRSSMADPMRWRRGYWMDPRWPDFQRAVAEELYRCLDIHGLTPRLTLLYWLSTLRGPLGRSLPLSVVLDYVEGRLSRRKVAQRLEGTQQRLDVNAVIKFLDRATAEIKRIPLEGYNRYLSRYLVDFLGLRRDLKLAYKTYETMDRIRLLEEPAEIRLSRSNGSLFELMCGDEAVPVVRRIRGHAVIKADVRGSTLITEQLSVRGLNPASHFSLNFFDPVNKLLPEFGAEKVFVEGDAVILTIFEYDDDRSSVAVARACGLARKILQVVTLQNVLNRRHGLPELELGLGVAYSRKEPNFLFDGGQRIMISSAINRADRLSACDSGLRRSGFRAEHPFFRVTVVRDARLLDNPRDDSDLMSFNVNGVKIEEEAFFRLQRELRLRQIRLPDEDVGDTLFFAGRYSDLAGHSHWLVVRYGPVREWNGQSLGRVDRDRRHFFEVIVEEDLTTRIRKLLDAGG